MSGVGDMMKKGLNKASKLLTPSATPVKKTSHKIVEEEDEDLEEDLLFEDSLLENEEEAEVEEEEELQDEDHVEEEATIENKTNEVLESAEINQIKEKNETGGIGVFVAVIIPLILVLLTTAVLVTQVPVENLGEEDSILRQAREHLLESWKKVTVETEAILNRLA